MALDIIDFDEVKAILGLSGNENNYPALEALESRVTAAVENYLLRQLAIGDRTEVVQLTVPTSVIKLSAIPVNSVASVDFQNFDFDENFDVATEVMIMNWGIEMRSLIGPGKLTVVYNGGLTNSQISADIKQAAAIQLVYEYQSKDWVGATTVTTEGGSKEIPELKLLDEVKRMLDRHAHPLRITRGYV